MDDILNEMNGPDGLIEPDEVNLCKDCPDEEKTMVPATEAAPVGEAIAVGHEPVRWITHWWIDKYEGKVTPEQVNDPAYKPFETVEFDGNLAVNSGIQRVMDLMIGAGGQAGDNTHTFMGVGNSSTAEAAGQTDLQAATGSTNRQWKGMDATFPSRASQTVTYRSTYATTEANFNWLEVGVEIDNGTVSPGTAALSTGTQKLLNRKVIAAGTKVNTQTWVSTVTITMA